MTTLPESKKPMEMKTISPEHKMSLSYEEAARVLSNLAIENVTFSEETLARLLNPFKLKPREKENLIELFRKKEEQNGN